jgi:hypothetical protein
MPEPGFVGARGPVWVTPARCLGPRNLHCATELASSLAPDTVAFMIGLILGRLRSAVVRGLAVVALVVVWSVGHIGTSALSAIGVSSLMLTTTATPADAHWYRRRWRRRRYWRRWRRWY